MRKQVIHDMKRGALRWIVAACNWRITQRIDTSGKTVTCLRCLKKKGK